MNDHRERAPCVDVRFPIAFVTEGSEFPGTCLNISKSGLLGEFANPLDLWTEGELALDFAEGYMGIKARVARAIDREAALIFLFKNAADRQFIETAVELAQAEMRVGGMNLDDPF